MVIGIGGKIGSGKDLIGRIIQYLHTKENVKSGVWEQTLDSFSETQCTIKIKKFADKLKDIICILIGCTREQLEDREFKETPLGEEWIRYGYANGFDQRHRDGEKMKTIMNNEPCSKERYEEERITNWQTAYKLHHTPRTLLQLVGTECMRNIIHPNTWVNALMSSYVGLDTIFYDNKVWTRTNSEPNYFNVNGQSYKDKKHEDELHQSGNYLPKSNWVITDMRFPNELEAVKERGFSIRVERPKDILEMGQIMPKEHPSETALDNAEFDYTIDNNGTIEELVEKVKEILIKENVI